MISLLQQRRKWLLLGLLVLLHLLLLEGVASLVGRTLLVGHIGLFILWQPFVRAEQRLSPLQLAVIAAVVGAATFWAGKWTLIFWTMALAGMIGGKVFFYTARGAKVFHMLVLIYLISVLLILLVPQVLPERYEPTREFVFLARYMLPALFVVMAALPMEAESDEEVEVVDFVYSAFVFLVLAVLVLGSIATMLVLKHGYIESLIVTIMTIGAFLLLMAWAWNPRLGFAGIGTLFSRYMLSLGLPFERWLHGLADNMQRDDEPEKFLAQSLEGMARLPWVNGCVWQSADGSGKSGRLEGRHSRFRHGQLSLDIYSQQPLSPALNWHFNLLTQLLGEFYEAKLRARELQQLSYVKAIHQTGARLTHDVKNLLQSLNTLCLAAANEEQMASPQYQALLRRQLPVIAQRLQLTLDKLRRPEQEEGQFVPAERWWADLQSRYAQAGVSFVAEALDDSVSLPVALFSSVAENLLENALAKKRTSAGLQVQVRFRGGEWPRLAVCDDGPAIPRELAQSLFRAPVASRTGLGIGLYQAARHAEFYGYELKIAANLEGKVCFELLRPDEAAPGE
ncbi:MAG TPA: sensor histidine kinase [Candidatus Desulfobacillus sp.]|nr:sensor histidine kinase [Candidatus Desulfobacillus sp.]